MSDLKEVESYVTSLKVVELKDELKKRHLPYVGNKQVLAQRLREDMLKALQQKTSPLAGEEEEDREEHEQEPTVVEPAQEEVRLASSLYFTMSTP